MHQAKPQQKLRTAALLFALTTLAACANRPPDNPADLCSIFQQKRGWEKHARRAEQRWGSSDPTMMAIMKQESAFIDNARPPRMRFLGIPLWWRKSSSYGYSQAKDATWRWYERSVGRNADRDDFDDAIDFIGWYNHQSHRTNGIAKHDTYSLYLAYHEGHGGYRKKSYRNKQWLLKVAARVRDQAARYQKQYARCR